MAVVTNISYGKSELNISAFLCKKPICPLRFSCLSVRVYIEKWCLFLSSRRCWSRINLSRRKAVSETNIWRWKFLLWFQALTLLYVFYLLFNSLLPIYFYIDIIVGFLKIFLKKMPNQQFLDSNLGWLELLLKHLRKFGECVYFCVQLFQRFFKNLIEQLQFLIYCNQLMNPMINSN